MDNNSLPPMRIAKRIAGAGLCSRRDAEQWILDGRVRLNGELVTSPAVNVTRRSIIEVDGQPLPDVQKPRLWGYYKPVGVVTTHRDPQGRPTLFEGLPEEMPRVISIGRLDLNSEGLILLTTSSEIARFAELPSNEWPRCYKVRVFGDVNEQMLTTLTKGITIEGIRYGRIEADLVRQSGKNSWLTVTLYEGKNREIRHVMRHMDLHVNRLVRLAYGPFSLGQRQPGELWEISESEMIKAFPFMKKDRADQNKQHRSGPAQPRTSRPQAGEKSKGPQKGNHASHRWKV